VRGIAAAWAVLAAIAAPVASAGGPALRQDKIPTYGIAVNVPASWTRVDPSRLASEHIAYATAGPGGQAYLFTYTALASAKTQIEQLFHASAATIRFLAAKPRTA
jgi:hypothetical protein